MNIIIFQISYLLYIINPKNSETHFVYDKENQQIIPIIINFFIFIVTNLIQTPLILPILINSQFFINFSRPIIVTKSSRPDLESY